MHGRDGEEWKNADPGLHSRETGLSEFPRSEQSLGWEFPGSFPKTASSSFGRLARPTSLATRSLLGFPVGSVVSWEKFAWIKGPAAQPDPPQCLEDLALGVESAVAHTAGARFARLVKTLDCVGAGGRFKEGLFIIHLILARALC